MAGKRTSLASLAGQPVEDVPGRSEPTLTQLPLDTLVRTPLNQRSNFGTKQELAELGESLRRQQLQPIVVVSRVSYLKQFPEHGEQVTKATYVIISGERRYRAANEVQLGTIEAVIREEVAASRKQLLDAVATENLDRRNLDPIEEAYTVEAMVKEFGSARAVAEHRGKHETWVSQRRSLLRLAPSMQDLVRTRDMPVEVARRLAKAIKDHGLTEQQQADWWQAERMGPRQDDGERPAPPKQRSAPQELGPAAELERVAEKVEAIITQVQAVRAGKRRGRDVAAVRQALERIEAAGMELAKAAKSATGK